MGSQRVRHDWATFTFKIHKAGILQQGLEVLVLWSGYCLLSVKCVFSSSCACDQTTFLYYFSFLVHCSVCLGLPWWPSGKKSACNAGDLGLIHWLGRFPGGGHGNPFQHSCLENPMDRGAWQALRSFRWWPLWPVYSRYHLVVLFGIDLIITNVDYLSMCFYFYFTSCENNLPLQSGFLKVGPVWNFFPQWFTPGHFLRAGVIYLPSQTVIYKPSRTCDYYEPFSICFKVYILIWTS